MGAAVAVSGSRETRGTLYAVLDTGQAIVMTHLRPLGEHAPDFVTVAETLLHTPYLWGGTTGFGIDCSGLVQLSMRTDPADSITTDFSFERKSSALMVATFVFDSGDHAPIEWGCLRA